MWTTYLSCAIRLTPITPNLRPPRQRRQRRRQPAGKLRLRSARQPCPQAGRQPGHRHHRLCPRRRQPTAGRPQRQCHGRPCCRPTSTTPPATASSNDRAAPSSAPPPHCTGGTVAQYAFDSFNRLSQSAGPAAASYVYDDRGRRVQKTENAAVTN